MQIVYLALLLDVESAEEAADGMNEILREQQRSYAPRSCLIDYAFCGPIQDIVLDTAGYDEGDFVQFAAIAVDATTVCHLRNAAHSYAENLSTGLDDGTYDDRANLDAVEAAIEVADRLLGA